MHELSLCDALLKIARDAVRDEGLQGVSRISVEIGSLSGVMPHFMADCWQAVIDGTEFADTELAISELRGTARCLDCLEEFPVDLNSPVCPKCGGNKLAPLTGRDMTVTEIEAY